jgi:flavin reductase (DIM6/NTAB) family NADH-FMN oxidoreductase RutF
MHVSIDSVRDHLPFDPFKAIVSPRPIGWISTISADGVPNLAPYSFFNALCSDPHLIAFSSAGWKDSVANCERTGEFVFNVVSDELLSSMNQSSTAIPSDESEFELCGLAMSDSQFVSPPRVARSPAALECRVVEIKQLADIEGQLSRSWLTIGQVIGVYIDPHFITADGRFNSKKAQTPSRCGYMDYMTAGSFFELERP